MLLVRIDRAWSTVIFRVVSVALGMFSAFSLRSEALEETNSGESVTTAQNRNRRLGPKFSKCVRSVSRDYNVYVYSLAVFHNSIWVGPNSRGVLCMLKGTSENCGSSIPAKMYPLSVDIALNRAAHSIASATLSHRSPIPACAAK